jgi:hypothetical protein
VKINDLSTFNHSMKWPKDKFNKSFHFKTLFLVNSIEHNFSFKGSIVGK